MRINKASAGVALVFAGLGGVALALSIVAASAPRPIPSTDWFLEHRADRDATLDVCKNDPDRVRRLGISDACINAGRAADATTGSRSYK